MKKLISFVLALVIMVTAVPSLLAIAEDAATPGFVIDGVLDQWYRDDEWAEDNGFYTYFNDLYDTSLDLVSRHPTNGEERYQMDMAEFNEDVKVKIYAAFDDHYAYFYVDVLDSNISAGLIRDDGTVDDRSQYIENIDVFVDTDVFSCEGEFFTNCGNYQDADTHFRMMGHNKVICDTRPEDKYIFEQETNLPHTETGEDRINASGYFSHPDNVATFHKYDDAGNVIGYGCEARVPLAYWYGYTEYQEVYYNIAVTNSATEADPTPCSITTGKRWLVAYDTGRTFYLDPDEPNPFLPAEQEPPVDDPEPTPTPTDVLDLGDPNDDGAINAKDALLVLKVSVGKYKPTDAEKVACDVNADNTINAKDALEILKKSVGKEACF